MQSILLPSLLKAPASTSNITSGGDDDGDGQGQSKSFYQNGGLWDDTEE